MNIEFIVTPLPVINENLIKIEQCDDGKGSENDGVTLHNLTESQSLFSSNFIPRKLLSITVMKI